MKSCEKIIALALTIFYVLLDSCTVVVGFQRPGIPASYEKAQVLPRRRQRTIRPVMDVASSTRSFAFQSNNVNDNHDKTSDPLETLTKIFTFPTPLLSNLPLGYPVSLLVVTAIFFPSPLAASVFPIILFAIFRYLGTNALFLLENDSMSGVDQDLEKNIGPFPIDFVAFVAAILSSFLVAPVGRTSAVTANTDYQWLGSVILAASVLTVGVILATENIEKVSKSDSDPVDIDQENEVQPATKLERSRMDRWDDSFAKMESNNKDRDSV